MRPVVLILPLLALAACAQENETPVVETEVAPTGVIDAETLAPADRSLADEAENSVTSPRSEEQAPAGEVTPEDPEDIGEEYPDYVSEETG